MLRLLGSRVGAISLPVFCHSEDAETELDRVGISQLFD
jgi:hypothetical protein